MDERERAETDLVHSILASSLDPKPQERGEHQPLEMMKDVFPSLKKLQHGSPQGPRLKLSVRDKSHKHFANFSNLTPFQPG